MRPRHLKVRGPFRGPSGYEHHVRELVREFHRQGVDVQLIDLPEWGAAKLPRHLRDPWFETLDRPVAAPAVLHFTMPHQVVIEPDRVNVNYTMFETTRIPDKWVEHSRRHDLVVVPTESSRRAWIAGGVPERLLRICPLGVDPNRFGRPVDPLPVMLDSRVPIAAFRTRFLNVSELGPRKNLTGLLRVWLRATGPADDAVLVVKVGCYAPGWREEFLGRVDRLEREEGRPFQRAAPVRFLFDLFSDDEMPRLYAAATHYLSLSHGEGWDQAMVEAAAAGLHLIAPNHSAYRAYLDESVATLLPAREVPAVFEGGGVTGELFASQTWWDPDESAAIAAIRAAIAGQDADRPLAQSRILSEFTWCRATERLLELLEEATAPRRSRWAFWKRS